MPDTIDPAAPHGRGADGEPLAPYGYKADGTPRLSNRGRKAGPAAPPKKATKNTAAAPARGSREQVQAQLVELGRMLTTPAAAAVSTKQARARLGERRADQLAGTVVILEAHLEPAAAAYMTMAEEKPGLLAFIDKMDDKLPYLALAQVGIQIGKAVVANWVNPSRQLAAAAAKLAPLRAAQYAAAVEAQAAAYGVQDQEIAEETERARQRPETVEQVPSEENGWTEFGRGEFRDAA